MTRVDTDGGESRVGLFGGTFDPFHLGHLTSAQEVLEELELDRVVFLPAGIPPHKSAEGLSPAGLRLRMVRAGIEDDFRFGYSDLELGRDGPSYTVDTLRELVNEARNTSYHLIMGADQWASFGTWRDPAGIARMAHLVVMTREGEGSDAATPELPGGHIPEHDEVPVVRLDISSTLVRERVRAGRSIRYLVPDPVRRIIEAAKLYV